MPWRYGDDNYLWNPGRAEQLAAIAPVGAEVSACPPICVATCPSCAYCAFLPAGGGAWRMLRMDLV